MRILESYPGEFQEIGPDAMEEKLHKALAQVAPVRGGELQLIADLARSGALVDNGQTIEDAA